ncbi:HNH endonuclease signature motif containing protein [Rudaeicoccus suwonensis]|uniref:HNH endonuclease n=1 Tax=Rudaeicoccus suwonensis TaxID=657409 RepID=A0A561E8X6_9MICO|nr:HNH endonuclease signature motif containing protein [Rudaeicoccus suwonensis]TWE12061.1 HNH endonuclease [Rudaeicoccus suwonensis]
MEHVPTTPDTPLAVACDQVTPAAPGHAAELLNATDEFVQVLQAWPAAIFQLAERDLTHLASAALTISHRAEAIAALAAADAVDRGVVAQSTAASTTQWVRDLTPGTTHHQARAIADIATAALDARNHAIIGAVRDGQVTVDTAATALREAEKVAPLFPTVERSEIHSWFLALEDFSPRSLRTLTRRLIAAFGDDQLADDEDHQQQVESLTWRELPTGMVRLIADLSPAHAAIVKEALNATSAPRPETRPETGRGAVKDEPATSGTYDADANHHDRAAPARDSAPTEKATTGSTHPQPGPDDPGHEPDTRDDSTVSANAPRDTRSPGKRRLDALLELITHATRDLDASMSPMSGTAKVVVLLPLDTLTEGRGHATTSSGDVIDPASARRLACDADLIPVVLGATSEPLDVGRQKRLVTAGLRTAVIVRDRHCTFPGCDRPPAWCEVHHIIPWWAGGGTSLTNSALVCARHHTIIHRDGYTATTTAGHVTWDLSPGRIGEQHNHSSSTSPPEVEVSNTPSRYAGPTKAGAADTEGLLHDSENVA